MNELAGTFKTSALLINYQRMVGIAQVLVIAERMGSRDMHLRAITACLPIVACAGHPNYLKSARLFLQKMHALEVEKPEVHQKFQSGFHVIRRCSQYWAGLGSDLVIEQTLIRSLKRPGEVGCQSTREQLGLYLPQCHLLTTLQCKRAHIVT